MNNPNTAVTSTQEAITKTAKISGFNEDQIKLVIQTVAKGATFPELQMFLYIAKKTGLDPLAKQIHFTKFKNKTGGADITIITGIDGYRSIASKTGKHAGTDDAMFDSEDNAKPKKATVIVYRLVGGKKEPFTATARWDEYFPAVEKKQFMWKKMPYTMLGKCAEALALRKAFPNDLSDVFVEEEMDQAHVAPKPVENIAKTFICSNCQADVSGAVANYSREMSGVILCKDCQTLKKDEPADEPVKKENVKDEEDVKIEDMEEEIVEEEISEKPEEVSTAPKGMSQLKTKRDEISNNKKYNN